MKKIFLLSAIASILATQAFCKDYLIHNKAEFDAIVGKVSAGDAIVIADGTYTGLELDIPAKGTATKPVTVRAQTPGKAVFTGDVSNFIFNFTGKYTVLSGFTFKGCNVLKANGHNAVLVEFNNTTYCRMTDCTFTQNSAKSQFMPIVVISGYGEHNEIDHCSFITDIDNMEVQVKVTNKDCPKYTFIHSNLFRDKPKVAWPIYNGGECVQIGQDPVLQGNQAPQALVRDNRFIHCDGEPEVISNKSTGNRYINNYFEDCQGELVMRGGHDCLVDSNTFKGGIGGIRVNGTGHTISNNNISNIKTAIRLMYGMAKGKNEIGFYIAPTACIIKNNHIENADIGILVGDAKDTNWEGKFDTKRYPSRTMQDVAPYDNQFLNNTFTKVATEIVYK